MQWYVQMADEQLRLDEEAWQLEEEAEQRHLQLERDAEEKMKEIEKKKPKINDFDSQQSVGSFIIPCPSTFALNKLDTLTMWSWTISPLGAVGMHMPNMS